MKKYAVPEYLTGQQIKLIRQKLTMTQREFAEFIGVSNKTIERWESDKKPITGPITTLVKILRENPQLEQQLIIPPKKYSLRLWYMLHQDICAIIDVDEINKKVEVINYTSNLIFRPFGINETPSYEDYEEFLESRCFPRTRDKMKLQLEYLELPFYDPMLIIEKTAGRMAEDHLWIRIER